MITYTVYYYVVGKTYTEGEVPHKIDVEVDIENVHPKLPATKWALNFAVDLAEFALKQWYPNEEKIFVRVERKNYCYR